MLGITGLPLKVGLRVSDSGYKEPKATRMVKRPTGRPVSSQHPKA